MTQPLLTIVRGHQGSGKTTYAEALVAQEPDLLHLENDHFLVGEDGYAFDWTRYAAAKAKCLEATTTAINNGQRVVVASTFTTHAEMAPYLELVPASSVRIVEMFLDFPNTHGVPDDVVQAKKAAFEPYPGATQITEPVAPQALARRPSP